MRSVWIFLGLMFVASPAFAVHESIIDYCLTTATPKACLLAFTAQEQAYQRALTNQRPNPPSDLPLGNPNNLLLLGIGPALIQGVNQGFHQMQLPYVDTPQFQYAPAN